MLQELEQVVRNFAWLNSRLLFFPKELPSSEFITQNLEKVDH